MRRNRFRMSLSNGAAGGARRCFVAGNDFSNGWLTTQVDVLCRGELEVDCPGTWHTDGPLVSPEPGAFSRFSLRHRLGKFRQVPLNARIRPR